MRLVILYRKSARSTWIPLLAALEDAGLLRQLELKLASWDEAVEVFESAHEGGQRVLFAMSLMTRDMPQAGDLLRNLAPLKRPTDLILVGGPHPSARPLETLTIGVDAVIVGEGEVAFADFIGRALSSDHTWRAAPSLCFLEGNRLVRNPLAPPIDLDRSRSVLPSFGMRGPMEITRGCRHNCGYCQTPRLWHGAERHRSVKSALRLLDGYTVFVQFLSPNALGYQSVTPGKPNTKALVELLSSIATCRSDLRLNIGNFPSEVRPEYVNKEVLTELRPLCSNRVMAIGAQSGSPRVLRHIGRGHKVEDVYRAVDLLEECGFVPYVDVIFGLPSETQEDEAMTRVMVDNLTRRNARMRAHIFTPLPGSRFEREPPGKPAPETVELLASLEIGGSADGDWREQLRDAPVRQPLDRQVRAGSKDR